MRYPHKCSRTKCRQRTVLARKIDQYTRRPKCPRCKRDTLKFDKYTMQRRLRRRACHCDGYHYPHRTGFGVWCTYSPHKPTDEDFYNRYGDPERDPIPIPGWLEYPESTGAAA